MKIFVFFSLWLYSLIVFWFFLFFFFFRYTDFPNGTRRHLLFLRWVIYPGASRPPPSRDKSRVEHTHTTTTTTKTLTLSTNLKFKNNLNEKKNKYLINKNIYDVRLLLKNHLYTFLFLYKKSFWQTCLIYLKKKICIHF